MISDEGAEGIAQIVPHDHPEMDKLGWGGLRGTFDPWLSLDYAAALMAKYLVDYDADYRIALAAYHAGPGSVAEYKGVPPFIDTAKYLRSSLGVEVEIEVRSGDTLWRLAREFGVTVNELLQFNGIRDPNKVQAGQRIRIPSPLPNAVGAIPNEDGQDASARPSAMSFEVFASEPPTAPQVEMVGERSANSVSTKKEGGTVPVFKDPAGNVLAPGSREVKYFGGDTSRPVIDKGDGSFLTPGNPKDAQWTASRIEKGKELGLDTDGWWEGNPVSIQSAINQAQIKKQTAPPPAALAPAKTTAKAEAKAEAVVVKDDWKQEIEREKLQLQREAQEDERRLAWFKAVSTLRGPRDWTSYWNSLRGGPVRALLQ